MQIPQSEMIESKVMGGDEPQEPSQTSSFEYKTLDEIELHDIENLKHIIAKCKTYHFSHPGSAQMAIGEALRLAVMRFGIEINGSVPEYMIHADLRSKGVRVESRFSYTGLDAYRNGIYVYRDNEIAYFISQIRPKVDALGRHEFFFFTNVDVMSSPRFYTIAGGGHIIQPAGLNTLKRPRAI